MSLSLKHVASDREQPCGACDSPFIPSEDSGSRVLSMKAAGENAIGVLLCGGCYSKWTHGMVITLQPPSARS